MDGILKKLNVPEELRQKLAAYTQNETFCIWGGFGLFAFTVFMVFSSGDFSFLLTLSSIVSVFSFLLVATTIESSKSAKGVSLKMMQCYIAVFVCRLTAIIPFAGYLPFDKSGDWLYQLCEAVGLCLSGSIVFAINVQYASTYDSNTDAFNNLWIIGPAAAVALIFHPHLNDFWPTDMAWAFALYLESVTVLPQFLMFMKEGKAQAHISHFLAAQALSRLLSFIFWSSSFSELSNPDHKIKQFVGQWVVVIQLIQLIIMGDFIYHYLLAIQKGIPVSECINYSSSNV